MKKTKTDLTKNRLNLIRFALLNKSMIKRELCKRSLFYFIQEFWEYVAADEFINNWHIPYLCNELMEIAQRVGENKSKKHDLIINIPPGTTKSITCSVMFPVWCWINWPWMRFITASYAKDLALEQAELSREIIRSEKFKIYFPDINIKKDKDTKSNFKIIFTDSKGVVQLGGNRYSTSTGGAMTGFHAHILIVDDPLDPEQAASETELKNANRWIDQTLPTRKINKDITPTILIMQRLHENDPSGHILAKNKKRIKHISIPAEIRNYKKYLKPVYLAKYYIDDLLDPNRMSWQVLEELLQELGQYGFSGQMGENPVPPGGGMFKVDHFQIIDKVPNDALIIQTIRYWDNAGTEGAGKFTSGLKMHKYINGKYIIADVKRGQWASEERERIKKETAQADGKNCIIYIEQEPGSGGKEQAQGTIRNLAGFSIYADRPTGDKIFRADPFSVQVNNGNVMLLRGEWNHNLIEEYRSFPFGTYSDQIDSGAGAFNKLAEGMFVENLLKKK